MSKQFFNWLNKIALFCLTFSVALFLSTLSVSAATYSVPQTAEAKISWDHNDPLPEGYRVYQRKSGQAYNYSSPVWSGANNSGVVYNLEYDTTYYFVVRAYEGTLESVDSDEVSFKAPTPAPATYSISATASGEGIISPAGVTTVTEGAGQTYAITPNSGYQIADVRVDGISRGALAAYMFSAVDGDHTISATFKAVVLADVGGGATNSDSANSADTQNSGVTILVEAEDGNIAWPMEIADDESAGAGGYVWTAEGSPDFFSPSDAAGSVTYDFEIPQNKNYIVWMRQISNTTESDSFFLSIDSQDEMVWHTKMGTQNEWTWDAMTLRNASDPRETTDPLRIWLTAGHHTLTIRQRESGTKLDALLITSDPILGVNAELVEEYFVSANYVDESTTSNSTYAILTSYSADRSNPVQLNGKAVDGSIYVFVEPITDIVAVEFFIDDVLYQTEKYAPYDLAGGATGGLAAPFDTVMLSTGLHKFSARITKTDGSNETIVADVTVPGHTVFTQLISKSGDRSNAYALEGATVDGDIYVFVEPATEITMVEFFIDDVLHQTEKYAPFDLAGGATGGLAVPFDTGTLSTGLHKFSARITKIDGSNETIVADVTVPGDTACTQLISKSGDRSNAYALEGATVNGNIYVFVEPATEIKMVEFFIDDVLHQTEKYAPYDLAGGATGGLAAPFDTGALSTGRHTFSARITNIDGTLEVIEDSVSVNHNKS